MKILIYCLLALILVSCACTTKTFTPILTESGIPLETGRK